MGRAGVTGPGRDHRPSVWPSPEEARRWVRLAPGHVTVVAGHRDGCEAARSGVEALPARASDVH